MLVSWRRSLHSCKFKKKHWSTYVLCFNLLSPTSSLSECLQKPRGGKKIYPMRAEHYMWQDFWSYEARTLSPDLSHPCRTQIHLDTFSTLENVFKYLIVFFLSWTRFGHAPTRTGYLHVLGRNILFNTWNGLKNVILIYEHYLKLTMRNNPRVLYFSLDFFIFNLEKV